MNTPNELLTTTEVAARFRVNSSQVRRWVKAGLLRPAIITPGKHYRFTEESLRAFTPPWRAVDQHTGAIAPIYEKPVINDEENTIPDNRESTA